ncbi:MAG: purine-nucleoside phosphorylase [Maribacter sp.]|jgi:purine-nucleoside phosphorylase
MDLYIKVKAAADFLQKQLNIIPEYAIIAGTGLSGLADDVVESAEILYNMIPYFPQSTVEGHESKMIFGQIKGRNVVVLKGRFHYYEGYSMDEVTFYVRVLSMLGVKKMIISNATGSLNENIDAGDIVLIHDHINLQPVNPLRGLNDPRLGNRFPTMDRVYDKKLLSKAASIAKSKNYSYHKGVYVGLQGPSLETAAEYKYMSRIGGDVVGMSTTPEIIVAAQCELSVLCISVCTNNPFKGSIATTIEEVIEVAHHTGEKVRDIICTLLENE